METSPTMRRRIDRVGAAFDEDGFVVHENEIVTYRDQVGVVAHHRTAFNYDTGVPKRAYYVEGTPFQMGYLMGRLAEPEIARMTGMYVDRVVRAMVREALYGERADFTGRHGPRWAAIHRLLIDTIYEMIRSEHVLADVPVQVHEEIRGILAGCRSAARREHRMTPVTEEELWVLNAGLDCVLSRVYSGDLLQARLPGLRARDLRVPIACNAFALLNDAAPGGALFGRDFMFPTGGIFQDVAALVVCNPRAKTRTPSIPFVNMTAPGIAGSIAAMNLHGVASGVHVAVGANSDSARPGLNSLLLVRDAIEHGATAESAVTRMVNARRGVSWNYMIVDGGHEIDRACVVEAGATVERIPFLRYPGPRIKALLPGAAHFREHPSGPQMRGAMVRWEDFELSPAFLERYNMPLWKRFGKPLPEDAFSDTGYIDAAPGDRNCPGAFYFAPPRGRPGQVVLMTNHYVIPEMRLCTMHPWAQRLVRANVDDSQWRYDELNHRILGLLDREGAIGFEAARAALDFLAPSGDYPGYYPHNPLSRDGAQKAIFGSTTLFDLKRRMVESHYGYFADDWVRITLPRYVEQEAGLPGRGG